MRPLLCQSPRPYQAIEVFLAEKPGEIDHSGALDPLDWVLGIGATFICRIKCDYGRDGVDYGVNLSVAASGRNPEYETFHKARIVTPHSMPWNEPREGPATA